MDIVGDAIRSLRIGEPRSARAYLYGHWGLRWDPSGGTGFNVTVVLQGDAWLRPEGTDPEQKATRLHAGDIVFVSRAIAHGVSDSERTPLVDVPVDERDFWFGDSADPSAPAAAPLTVLIGGSYYFDREGMHPLIESLPPVVVLPSRLAPGDPIGAIVGLLGAEHDAEAPGTSAAIPALLDLLLTYVIRAAFEASDASNGWAVVVRDRAMSAALLAMQNEPERSHTVESLARASGMSRATFARRFAALVGQPPLRYLTWCRMTRAKQLLTDTDLPLAAVARRCGYGSEFAFAKAFRREAGTAPGAYRRAEPNRRHAVIARR